MVGACIKLQVSTWPHLGLLNLEMFHGAYEGLRLMFLSTDTSGETLACVSLLQGLEDTPVGSTGYLPEFLLQALLGGSVNSFGFVDQDGLP